MNMVKLFIILIILSPVSLILNVKTSKIELTQTTAPTVKIIDSLPFNSSSQIYVFTNGYAVCNGSIAIIKYNFKEIITNATKIIYLPKYNVILYLGTDGLYKIQLPDMTVTRIFTGSLDGFWVSVGQDVIYGWCSYTLRAIDLSGLIKASVTFDSQIMAVVPYAYDYYLFVATYNGSFWKDYIYSDGRKFTLYYVRTRAVTNNAFFVDWGGDRTLIYANNTHLIFWRTRYDTVTVYKLPTALSQVDLFQAINYWSYAVVLASDDTVVVYAKTNWYTYSFSGGISYAKTYIGMRTWGYDYPWIVIASNDGLRLVYIDPDTKDWTSQIIYEDPINSDIFIDDLDNDGSEEFYFVNQIGDLVGVEITQIQYTYSYRAVIPSLYFWAGKFIIYDHNAKDWDGDGLTNDREVNELQTSLLKSDTDNDGLNDYEEVYTTFTNPVLNDTDRDNISDGDELNIYNTNPTKFDTDGDGLSDGYELALGTNPLDADTDKDGLLDGDEVKYGTNATSPDTDNDGLPDGLEILYKTNASNLDTDGDGLNDYEEINIYNTTPLDRDTDNDGLTDYEEVKKYKTDPLNPDSDGDGVSDGVEVSLGFDPLDKYNNPNSLFHVVTAFWWVFFVVLSFGIIVGVILTYLLKYVATYWTQMVKTKKTNELSFT